MFLTLNETFASGILIFSSHFSYFLLKFRGVIHHSCYTFALIFRSDRVSFSSSLNLLYFSLFNQVSCYKCGAILLSIQGTAGVAIAGLLGAVRAQGRPMIDFPKMKIVVAGAGRLD